LFVIVLGLDACVILEGAQSKSFEDRVSRMRVDDSKQLFVERKASVP
jgi:hypothetical protein